MAFPKFDLIRSNLIQLTKKMQICNFLTKEQEQEQQSYVQDCMSRACSQKCKVTILFTIKSGGVHYILCGLLSNTLSDFNEAEEILAK